MSGETNLIEKLEEQKEINLNLRFDSMNEKLTRIETLLTEYNELSRADIKDLQKRVSDLETVNKNCAIKVLKPEVIRYSKETSFLRGVFKNPWKGVLLLTLWIIAVVSLVLVFGPSAIFEILLKLKGL